MSLALEPDRPWHFFSESNSNLPSHMAGLVRVDKLLPGWIRVRLEIKVSRDISDPKEKTKTHICALRKGRSFPTPV